MLPCLSQLVSSRGPKFISQQNVKRQILLGMMSYSKSNSVFQSCLISTTVFLGSVPITQRRRIASPDTEGKLKLVFRWVILLGKLRWLLLFYIMQKLFQLLKNGIHHRLTWIRNSPTRVKGTSYSHRKLY